MGNIPLSREQEYCMLLKPGLYNTIIYIDYYFNWLSLILVTNLTLRKESVSNTFFRCIFQDSIPALAVTATMTKIERFLP